jgi:hypothetical protein
VPASLSAPPRGFSRRSGGLAAPPRTTGPASRQPGRWPIPSCTGQRTRRGRLAYRSWSGRCMDRPQALQSGQRRQPPQALILHTSHTRRIRAITSGDRTSPNDANDSSGSNDSNDSSDSNGPNGQDDRSRCGQSGRSRHRRCGRSDRRRNGRHRRTRGHRPRWRQGRKRRLLP